MDLSGELCWRLGGTLQIYKALNATPQSVIGVLDVPDNIDANQSRVFGYLKTFIGNLDNKDLRNCLRFITGSSVMIDQKITVSFNNTSGLCGSLISHLIYTCSCILELSSTYLAYPEFAEEFFNVLSSKVAWPIGCRLSL